MNNEPGKSDKTPWIPGVAVVWREQYMTGFPAGYQVAAR